MRKSNVVPCLLAAAFAVALANGVAVAGGRRYAILAPRLPPRVVSIGLDRGGEILDYGLHMMRWRQNGTRIRFSGNCQSACTLYLKLASNQACISPGASFSFHLPFGTSERGNRVARDFLMRNYPGWVKSWIRSQGGLSSGMKTMGYDYASHFIKSCGSVAARRGSFKSIPRSVS